MPQRDYIWIGGKGLLPFPCPRLKELWIETTFANVCSLVRAAEQDKQCNM